MTRGDRYRRQRSCRGSVDAGYVTAETAVVLPALLLVLALGIWVLQAVGAQLRCTDAAAMAARAAARGDAAAVVEATGRRAAPAGAAVEVVTGAETVTVRVDATVRPLGGVLAGLPGLHVSGRAVAAREDQVG